MPTAYALAARRPSVAREALVAGEVLLGSLLERLDLVGALEHVGVDDRDAHEHHALEVPREHAEQREQRVPAEPAVAADEEDGHRVRRATARRAPALVEGRPGRARYSRCTTLASAEPSMSSGDGQIRSSWRIACDDEVVVALDEEAEADDATPVMSSVSQPPSVNFSSTVTTRMVTQSRGP